MVLTPFRIRLGDDVLVDLDDRVARSRFTTPSDPTPWNAGADPAYLRGLVDYWRDSFDWRSREHWPNSYPQFIAQKDDGDLHFGHLRAADGAAALPPILLAHGLWATIGIRLTSNRNADRCLPSSTRSTSSSRPKRAVIPSCSAVHFASNPSAHLSMLVRGSCSRAHSSALTVNE